MKVLFIYPNLHAQIGFNYGISYISGLLKAHNIETYLLNINDKLGYPLDLQRIKKDVLSIKPDMIGFSVLTNQYKYSTDIAQSIKTYCDVPVVFGGIHPTMDPLGTASETAVDYLCIGEGEEAVLEFIQKGSAKGVKNFAYMDEGRFIQEPLRPFTDITKLPFKDYDIFDFQNMIDAKDGWVGLIASRGCPFRCTYCLNHKIMKLYKDHGHLPRHYMRRHTVDEIINEIDYLLTHYKRINMFIFDDDIFTFDKKWLYEFSEKYKSITNIGFVCNAHAKIFDNDVAHVLKEAGCRIVKFGLESGSDRIRRGVLNRYMSNRDIEHAFDSAHKYGIHTSAFVMMGLPHEEPEDIFETVELIARVKPGRVRWSLFFPFVGTKAYDIAKGANLIDFEKMHALDNFTDETCMMLKEDVKLLVDKLKSMFCLFINGFANMDGKHRYWELLKIVEAAADDTWLENKKLFIKQSNMLDKEMEEKGVIHYTVKYNPFMGVRSDWKDDSISA